MGNAFDNHVPRLPMYKRRGDWWRVASTTSTSSRHVRDDSENEWRQREHEDATTHLLSSGNEVLATTVVPVNPVTISAFNHHHCPHSQPPRPTTSVCSDSEVDFILAMHSSLRQSSVAVVASFWAYARTSASITFVRVGTTPLVLGCIAWQVTIRMLRLLFVHGSYSHTGRMGHVSYPPRQLRTSAPITGQNGNAALKGNLWCIGQEAGRCDRARKCVQDRSGLLVAWHVVSAFMTRCWHTGSVFGGPSTTGNNRTIHR